MMYGYQLKDAYVPSFDTSGSGEDAAEPLPRETLTMDYTRVDFDKGSDEFVFVSDSGGAEKPKFEWIEIVPPRKPPGDYSPYDSEVPEYDLTDVSAVMDDGFVF
jgi:hypothetical protein